MRYLPLNDDDRADMLARIGVSGIDALFADIPKAKRLECDLDLPPRKTEMEVERLLSGLAAKNVAAGSVPFFVGAGAYKHHVPASVDHLIQRSEFSHELCALSARNRARHIANDFRVPDPGCGLDLDGCRQCVDV